MAKRIFTNQIENDMRPKRNLTGQVFGRLTVTSVRRRNNVGRLGWVCRCVCGNTITALGYQLGKNVSSCGCLRQDRLRVLATVHGFHGTPVYGVWRGMIDRCTNAKKRSYPAYGGRGIKVCDRWQTFHGFFADMGHPPKGKSIDRIDNNGNYEPGNCRWATIFEQANNTRSNRYLQFKGETRTMAQWARHLNLPYSLIFTRLKAGWTIEATLTKPVTRRAAA